MQHSRRNVTRTAKWRYLDVFVSKLKDVVSHGGARSSVQWLIQQLNRFVGLWRPRSRKFLDGLKPENRCNGLRFAAGDMDCQPTWLATCTRNRGSKYVCRFHDELKPSRICTTKYQPIGMRLVQCKELPSIFLVRRDGLKAERT